MTTTASSHQRPWRGSWARKKKKEEENKKRKEEEEEGGGEQEEEEEEEEGEQEEEEEEEGEQEEEEEEEEFFFCLAAFQKWKLAVPLFTRSCTFPSHTPQKREQKKPLPSTTFNQSRAMSDVDDWGELGSGGGDGGAKPCDQVDF